MSARARYSVCVGMGMGMGVWVGGVDCSLYGHIWFDDEVGYWLVIEREV